MSLGSLAKVGATVVRRIQTTSKKPEWMPSGQKQERMTSGQITSGAAAVSRSSYSM
jgi:hypothetical protein